MRIGFFLRYPFHESIFRTTLAAVRTRHECLVTGDPRALTRFRPHVVVAAEDITYLHLRAHLPRSIFIHTRHGLASKGVPERSFRAADYVCVTSEFVRYDFLRRGVRPRRGYWVLGYVQMDNLFVAERPAALPPGRRVVLYAPTWHEGLSSLPVLGDRIVDLLRGRHSDTMLVIKPHPLVQQGARPSIAPWMETLRHACRGRDDVILLEQRGLDVMPWLNAADVLVSDASSVQLEFLALNRPIVLINNPARLVSPHYDPSGYEWAWRDMGDAVDDIETLPTIIDRALANPHHGEADRARYRERLFGSTADGHAGERLASHIDRLAPEVASELELLALSPFGLTFARLLPHFRTLADTRRRWTQRFRPDPLTPAVALTSSK
ncbi:CDP-glycerol glycerophosphotransferase family protein [Horticoccus luteus]|uniref:CDP-glycerol glycerophosphotransferase family protein n=1 Tax=Horticoccus luteus TaxID=2862869 RepID=A0A8F9XIY0_9BACT|nr:CDP-glycerol glycerophosphotransferase family protein [Horticoccus luteus]QYM78068.1 CDP-glycerol glycerophosphotransferase family protein [Horticoccus luteus]